MNHDLSSLIGKRYIFFNSFQSQNMAVLQPLYTDATERINTLSSAFSSNSSREEGEQEQHFRFNLLQYLSTIKAMSEQMQKNEKAFIESQRPLLVEAGIDDKTLSIIDKLGSGGITEQEYQSIISLINIIRYGGDIEKLKRIIKEQRNNIKLMETNVKKMENEIGGVKVKSVQLQDMERKYVHNYGAYRRDFASTLLKSVRENDLFYNNTLAQKYTDKVNGIIRAIGKDQDFIQLLQEVVKNQPNDKTVTITEHDLFNSIFDRAIRLVDKEINSKQWSTTLAKQIINQMTDELQHGIMPAHINSEFVNVMKASPKKTQSSSSVSLEEIAIRGNKPEKNLADALSDAQDAIAIISKFGDSKKQKDNIDKWNEYIKLLHSAETDSSVLMSAKKKFNQSFRNTILNSNTQIKNLSESITKMSSAERNKAIADLSQQIQLSYASSSPALDGTLNGMCTLSINKSSLAEIIGAHQNEFVDIISNKLPGTSVNLKNDIYYVFKINNQFAEIIAQNRSKKILEDITAKINSIIDKSFGSFMEKYHKLSSGETNVAAAELTYVQSMKEMIADMNKLFDDLELSTETRAEAWKKLSDTFISSISVKEYTLYSNKYGYHGGSLGKGGAPEGVINNVNKMYELGGISAIDKEALMFGILNCAPSAIGSQLKEHLENYLLGGAALIMFDEGFTASDKYLADLAQEVGLNTLPSNLNLYLLNGTYYPASYVLYSIYSNLSAFYGQLDVDIASIQKRNRVVIMNNATLGLARTATGSTLAERFSSVAIQAESKIKIQFLFMAGMLDILENLGNAFKIK